MKISEWFNPRNIEHIKGYQHYQETGKWPQSLNEEIIQLEDNNNLLYPWSSHPELIRFARIKMADCWVKRFIWDDKANTLCMKIMDELDEARNEHKEE